MNYYNPWDASSNSNEAHSCFRKILASPQAMEFHVDKSNSIVGEALKQSHSIKILSQLHKIDSLHEELLNLHYKLTRVDSYREILVLLSISAFENHSHASEEFTELLSTLTEHRSLISAILRQETSDINLSADSDIHCNVIDYWRDLSNCILLVSKLHSQLNCIKELSESSRLIIDIEALITSISSYINILWLMSHELSEFTTGAGSSRGISGYMASHQILQIRNQHQDLVRLFHLAGAKIDEGILFEMFKLLQLKVPVDVLLDMFEEFAKKDLEYQEYLRKGTQ